MIDYSLAKELRAAGFPQNTTWASVLSPFDKKGKRQVMTMNITEENDGYANLVRAGYDVVALPTLGEMIEVCGKDFGMLFKVGEEWTASSEYDEYPTSYPHGIGATPSEAVSRLWLALQVNQGEKWKNTLKSK